MTQRGVELPSQFIVVGATVLEMADRKYGVPERYAVGKRGFTEQPEVSIIPFYVTL
jgi:hypothetical protein